MNNEPEKQMLTWVDENGNEIDLGLIDPASINITCSTMQLSNTETAARVLKIMRIAGNEYGDCLMTYCKETGFLWWKKYVITAESLTIGRRFDLCLNLMWRFCPKLKIILKVRQGFNG